MKKNLLYLFTVLCVLSFFSSCNDDEKPEVPPTVDEVLATYSADKLKAEIDGVAASEDAKVEIAEKEDKTISIKLFNIVPGAKEVEVPNAKFEAVTKSAYISKLTGEVSDNVSGYKIVVDGTVEEKILTAKISLTELSGDTINTKPLQGKVYKGKMNIGVTGMEVEPIDQRVYILTPYKFGNTKRDTAMIKLQIKNFTFETMSLGNISIDTIIVQKRGDVYGFNVEKREIKLDKIGTVLADLRGVIIGGKIELNLDIDATGLKVKVDFAGDTIVESQEAKLTNMKIENPAIINVKDKSNTTTVQFWNSNAGKLVAVTPTFTLSEKAKVDSISLFLGKKWVKRLDLNSPLDLSVLNHATDDYIQYTISAEDPNTQAKYKIAADRLSDLPLKFTMDKWVASGEPEGLMSSNDAASLLPFMGIKVPKPVARYGQENVVRIMTFRTDTANQPMTLVPAITAGTMFTGTFSIDIENTLRSTKFGIPYNNEPATFKITYKYTPGPAFFKQVVVKVTTDKGKEVDDNVAELVPGKTDECSINAYLYEVNSYDETLDGTNINTSDKVIMRALLPSGEAVADYKTLELPFVSTNNGAYDPSKKYKIAIVCSSSKDGDKFEGAPESILYVKHLEVVAK